MSQPPGASTLGSGNLRDVVSLPEGEDKDEWLAVNVLDLFNQVRMLYGTVCSQCTTASCPVMSAGQKHEYYWSDGDRRLSTPASAYIDYVFTYVQNCLDDENIFPSQIGRSFPRNFHTVCQSIIKRLFRVYAHIYHAHGAHIRELKATPHLNTSFKQFILFATQFNLLPNGEREPLKQVIEKLVS